MVKIPEYFNLSKFSTSEGFVDSMRIASELTNFFFGYSLLIIIFVVPIMFLKRTRDLNSSMNVSSLFSFLFSLFFYSVGWIGNTALVWAFGVTFITTIFIRWYNTRK